MLCAEKRYEEEYVLISMGEYEYYVEENLNGSFNLVEYYSNVPILMNWWGKITPELIKKCDRDIEEIYEDDGYFSSYGWRSKRDDFIERRNNKIQITLAPYMVFDHKGYQESYLREDEEIFEIEIPKDKSISLISLLDEMPYDLSDELDKAIKEEIEAIEDYESYVHMITVESYRW